MSSSSLIPKRIFLFDHARITSNLCMKTLGENPQISKTTYLFFNAFMIGPESLMRRDLPEDTFPKELRLGCRDETYPNALIRLSEHIEKAEEDGRIPFI